MLDRTRRQYIRQEDNMPTNRITIATTMTLAFSMILPVFGQSATGTIQGTVTSEGGTPISRASVIYNRVRQTVLVGSHVEPMPGEVLVSGSASSDSTGAF